MTEYSSRSSADADRPDATAFKSASFRNIFKSQGALVLRGHSVQPLRKELIRVLKRF